MNVAGAALIVVALSLTNAGLEVARFLIGAPSMTPASAIADRCFRAGSDRDGCKYTYEVTK